MLTGRLMAERLPVLISCLCAALYLACRPAVAANLDPLFQSVQPIYNVTEKFLDFIQPYEKTVLLNDVLTTLFNTTTGLKTGNGTQTYVWQAIIRRYWDNMMGYFILACTGIFLIIAIPLTGLITCCCRCCCHKCGGTGRQMEKRGSACKRGLYGFLLVLLTTMMVLGVVLAFISNELIRQQMDSSSNNNTMLANFSATLSELSDMLDDIPVKAKSSSASAVATLVAAVLPATSLSMQRLRDMLGTSSKADVGLATALVAMQQLALATNYSGTYVNLHSRYSSSLSDLNTMLSMLKTNLSGIDVNCPFNAPQLKCDTIAKELPGLSVTQTAANTGLANVTEINALLSTIDWASNTRNLTNMKAALENVTTVAMAYINSSISDVRNTLNSTSQLERIWSAVEKLFNSLGGFITNSSFSVNNSVVDPLTQTNKPVSTVVSNLDLIRYAVYLGIASLASLIIVLYFIGVTYGFCGEPPYEDARCCNRGAGGRLLMTGTVISFLCYSLLFVVILALFLVGGLTDTEVCRYLTGRAGSSGYRQLDSNLNQVLQVTTPELSRYSLNLVSGLLDGCSSGNASITAALNIQSLVAASDIDSLVQQFINRTSSLLQSRRAELVAGVAVNLNLTSVEFVALTTAMRLLTSFIAELQNPVIANADSSFIAILNISQLASRTEDKVRFSNLYSYINVTTLAAKELVRQQLNSLTALTSAVAQLNASATGITKSLQDAHFLIQTPLTVELGISEAMLNLTSQLQLTVRDTVARVIGAAADCAAVNQKLTVLVRGPCVIFLRPFNGFWTGMGIFLICLLPCLLLTVKLANLYSKTHKYQEDYIDQTLSLRTNPKLKLAEANRDSYV